MKWIFGMILSTVCFPLLAAAQGADYAKGHAYFYAAPGVEPVATVNG